MGDFIMPDLQDVYDAVSNDDSRSLSLWLHEGMPLDTVAKNESLLNIAAENGAQKCLGVLVEHGVNLDNASSEEFSALYSAISGGHPKTVHALLESGAKSTTDNPLDNYLHIAAYPYVNADKSIEMMDRFLAEGIDMHAENGTGKLPLNIARRNYELASMMTYRYDLDSAISSRKIDKESLHETRKKPGLDERYHQNWLEMPITWAWMDRIIPQLEKIDECITRAEVEQSPKNVVWAMLGDNLPLLDAHLEQQGERGIGLGDFVDGRGKATPTLEMACEMWMEKRLLEQEWVKGLEPQELRTLYKAMPEEARERIPDYHQVVHAMRDNPQQQTGMGR